VESLNTNEWTALEVALSTALSLLTLTVIVFAQVILPRKTAKRQTALAMYHSYSTNEMVTSRRRAFVYFNKCADDRAAQFARVNNFWKWSVLPTPSQMHSMDDDIMHARRVFDFWDACEHLLADQMVDERLLKSLLGHTFSRWQTQNLECYIRNPDYVPDEVQHIKDQPDKRPPTQRAAWIDGYPLLTNLMNPTEKVLSISNIRDKMLQSSRKDIIDEYTRRLNSSDAFGAHVRKSEQV
jgi:hypothetical protein